MSSFTGLKTLSGTSINNSGEIRLTDQLNPGTIGQVIISQGEDQAAIWGTGSSTIANPLTMGTNLSLASGNASFNGSIADTINATNTDNQLNLTGGNGVSVTDTGGFNRTIATDNDGTTINNSGGTGTQNQVLKVPNDLTAGTNISFSSGTTYNGSAAITINSTDTDNQLNLTEGNGITITNTGGFNRTIAVNADGTTLSNNVGSGQAGVLKVPNVLTKGTNISFVNTTDGAVETTYDGSTPITISSTDTDTQLNLTQGANIVITDTGGVNRTIALNDDITNQDTITFTSTSGTTALTGNNYPNNQTPMTNFDLTDTSNIVSPYFFHDVYDPASLDSDSLSTSYANIFSSNLFNSFTAQQTSCAIELRVYNAQTSSFGRSTFARLNGSSSTSSTAEFTTFYSTGGRDTTRTLHQADESDDVYLTMTWVLTGLTIGNSYNLYPQMRSTSSSGNFIRAGGSNAPAILRGYYLPTSGGGM